MPVEIIPKFERRQTKKAQVQLGKMTGNAQKPLGQAWRLKIPAGPGRSYRLAQLDDYGNLRRQNFPWSLPLLLKLRARTSSSEIPGTWGFGLWNDPFSLSLGLGGGTRHLPTLPNAAWFFFASAQNYLSFRDNKPAQGFLAQSFRSPRPPTPLLILGAMAFPLLLWSKLARHLRPLFQQFIAEDSFLLDVDSTQWHEYSLEWRIDGISFRVDDQTYRTAITPKGPLGLVIWIDNQFAAFPPNGRLSYGTLENLQSAWLKIENLSIIRG